MTQIAEPEFTLSLLNADTLVANESQRALIVGSMLSGTATAEALVEGLSPAGSPEDALFGRTSQVASMIRAFRRVNKVTALDVIAFADVGTASVFTITIVGTSSAAGQLFVTAGSEKFHKYTIAVPISATVTATALLIEAAINADLDCPFTAVANVGVITLTCDYKGLLSNHLGVECAGSVPGITGQAVAIGTPGATDPTTTTTFAVVGGTTRYQAICWPFWGSATPDLDGFLNPRFNISNDVLDGTGFVGFVGTYAQAITEAGTHNNQNLVIQTDETQVLTNYKGPSQNEPIGDKLAVLAAIKTLRLTEGANISNLIVGSASLDQFGGKALASLPYFNTPTEFLSLIKTGRGYTPAEIALLETAGAMVLGNNPAKTGSVLGPVVTTYKTDSGGNLDPTWKFLNYVETASGTREYIIVNARARFAQSRLTGGEVSRGRETANALIIKGFIEQMYQDCADDQLVQGGAAAVKYFKQNLTVTPDLVTGTAAVAMLLPIVVQLRGIIGTMKVTFNIS